MQFGIIISLNSLVITVWSAGPGVQHMQLLVYTYPWLVIMKNVCFRLGKKIISYHNYVFVSFPSFGLSVVWLDLGLILLPKFLSLEYIYIDLLVVAFPIALTEILMDC